MTRTRVESFCLSIVRGAALGLLLSGLPACEEAGQDDFRSEGGTSPDPTGIITGAVAYLGPPPHCEYDADGEPSRVIGRVILTMFEYTNPSPPEGRATSAVNLLVMKGSDLFTLDDCLPKGQTPNPLNTAQTVTRSAPIYWPQITLRPTPQAYQIRGFYDTDEDMNPFFNVKNLPTEGDIVGGAVIDILNPQKGFLPVEMPALNQAKDGFVRQNITVGLNTPVWTERPAFKLSEDRFLSAEEHVPVDPIDFTPPVVADQAVTLDSTWGLTCKDGADLGNPDMNIRPTCGLTIDLLRDSDPKVKAAFAAGDVEYDFNERKSAFYIEPVDVRTIVKDKPDVILSDGKPDPHPVLGATTSLDVDWYTPMVIFQRRAWVQGYDPSNATVRAALDNATAVELAAGIPSVSLVGTTLPKDVHMGPPTMLPDGETMGEPASQKRTVADSIRIAVAPVAVVDLNRPGVALSQYDPSCRVPYIPFGTTRATTGVTGRSSLRSYESRYTVCQEVPSGLYAVNVLSGVAGGVLTPEPDPDISENGFVAGAPPGTAKRFSGQVWSIPNPLGDTAQIGSAALASQGWDNMFVVYDPDPASDKERRAAPITEDLYCRRTVNPDNLMLEDIEFNGICGKPGQPAAPFIEDADDVDSVICLPQTCCDNVAHLCGVPLCEPVKYDDNDEHNLRKSPTRIVKKNPDGSQVPDCIPFLMPPDCCPNDYK